MGIMNLKYWNKAYMLEFQNTQLNTSEFFIFSLPPESEDIQFPQRVVETKTFAGSVLEDYGSDTIPITLSGSTINQEKKLVYRGKDGQFNAKYLTGEQEVFELQKLISDWSREDLLPVKKVYLYDLSKLNNLELLGAKGSASRNYWQIAIRALKIRRAKDKPRTYLYTLEMLAIEDEAKEFPGLFSGSSFVSVLDAIQKGVEIYQAILTYTELIADGLDEIMQEALKAKELIENIGKLDGWGIVRLLDAPLRILGADKSTSLYSTSKSIVGTTKKVISLVSKEETEEVKKYKTDTGGMLTVAFNTMGGNTLAHRKVNYGDRIIEPAKPIKDKYSFQGWYKEAACIEPFSLDMEIKENTTVYAKWKQEQAVIQFNTAGGSKLDNMLVSIGSTATVPMEPKKRGQAFGGWYTTAGYAQLFDFAKPILGDITIYAQWLPAVYINWQSNGGSEVSEQQIATGGKAVYPKVPELKNHVFLGWYTSEDFTVLHDFSLPVMSDLILYAKWEHVTNTVYFVTNGGSAIAAIEVAVGEPLVQPADPSKSGYYFDTWCSDLALQIPYDFSEIVVEDIYLYAKWEPETHTVTFDVNGGSVIPQDTVKHGEKAVFPEIPIKANAIFDRWCYDNMLDIEYDFNLPVTHNLTLYARWYE